MIKREDILLTSASYIGKRHKILVLGSTLGDILQKALLHLLTTLTKKSFIKRFFKKSVFFRRERGHLNRARVDQRRMDY